MTNQPEEAPEIPIRAVSMIASRTGHPAVVLTIGDHMTQMTAEKAREVGGILIDVAHAADADAFLFQFLRDKVGADLEAAAVIVQEFRTFRDQNGEAAARTEAMSDREDRAWKEYDERFRKGVWPQLYETAVFLSLCGNLSKDEPTIDTIKASTQLGYAMLLGKPLLLVVPKGVTIPAGLVRAADAIVYDFDPTDPGCQGRIQDALQDLGILERDR